MRPTPLITRRLLLGSVAASGSAARAAAAAAAAPGALTIGLGGAVTSIDPHFYSTTPNNAISMHIFDRLIERTGTGRLMPGLATEWRALTDTLWEFKLRQGVTWQNGTPFSAHDVAFTVGRARNVPNSPGGFSANLRGIKDVQILDDHTIRFVSPEPTPSLPVDLTIVAIVSRDIGRDATTADYNSGKAAIGTGPYKLVRYSSGELIELVRNEQWWGRKPEWDRVTFRQVPNIAARTASLLAGDLDLIEAPSAGNLPRLREDARVSIFEAPSYRVSYVMPIYEPAGGNTLVTDASGKPLARTPLLQKGVRQALSLAINRSAVAERIMYGTADATGQWLPDGFYSHIKGWPAPAYDPVLAKKLLADAGYPDGFRIPLHTANDRTPYNVEVCQAIAQMWSRIGVQATVEAMPFSMYSTKASSQQFAVYFGSWGSSTLDAGSMLLQVLATYDPTRSQGMFNFGRYSDPTLDAMVQKALSTVDDAAREELLIAAEKKALDDVSFIPVYQFKNIWLTRKGLSYDARSDEFTLAMGTHTT